jgi:Ca2+-binding RTX toxin-like protein
MWGGGGADRLVGGKRGDHFHGGPGDDVIRADDGSVRRDSIWCGDGLDTVFYDEGVDRFFDEGACEVLNPG